MSYDPQTKTEDKKSIFGVIMHSFFVVPFLLAVFSVLLFAAVRILTMEKHSVYDYIEDVKEGAANKRWQAAFELSRILSEPKAVPTEEKFVQEMNAAFEASRHDDDRVRQYLALAMGRTGKVEFVAPLMKGLVPENIVPVTSTENSQNKNFSEPQEKDENVYAIITALGILKNDSATNALLKYLDHSNPKLRLAAVIALGNIGSPQAKTPLKRMLNDIEPNVTWDAAIALAKMNDDSGKGLILKLLDREYLNTFPNVDPQQQTRIMCVALHASAGWNSPETDAILKKLFASDKNMKVRAMAHEILEQHKP